MKIRLWNNTFETDQPDVLVNRRAKGIFGKDACPFWEKMANLPLPFAPISTHTHPVLLRGRKVVIR